MHMFFRPLAFLSVFHMFLCLSLTYFSICLSHASLSVFQASLSNFHMHLCLSFTCISDCLSHASLSPTCFSETPASFTVSHVSHDSLSVSHMFLSLYLPLLSLSCFSPVPHKSHASLHTCLSSSHTISSIGGQKVTGVTTVHS